MASSTTTQLVGLLLLILLVKPTVQDQGIVFHPIGHLATDTTSYLLVGQMDLRDTFEQTPLLDLIKNSVSDTYNRLSPHQRVEKALIRNQVRLLANHLNDVKTRIEDLRVLTHLKAVREKRSILLLAGLAALGAGLSSLWYSHQISQ